MLAVAAAVPAASASGTLSVAVVGSFGGGGFTFDFNDGKWRNPNNPNTDRLNDSVVSVPFEVKDGAGNPVVGATVVIVGDNTTDGEGNFLIGASNVGTTGNIGESPVKRTSSQTTNNVGRVVVKLSTATFSQASCAGGFPRSGTLTATVSHPNYTTTTVTFTYRVTNRNTINCP